MKRSLLIIPLILLIASTAFAQLPPVGYIGLFTDINHDTWCVTGTPFYSADVWIWCLPSDEGQICAEFALSYPATGIIASTVTANVAIISVQLGDLPNGMSVCYQECQWDWNWCFHQQVFVSEPGQMMIEIIVHSDPDIDNIQFSDCRSGFPISPAIKFTNFYINYDPVTAPECQVAGIESRSWGAIKGLLAE